MKELKARLIEKISRTPTVSSFKFIPSEKISFLPGQAAQIILDESNRSNKDLNKYLSFSSSPGKNYIELTKRLSQSDFSIRLNNLKINDEVMLKAPLGGCVFEEKYKKITFLIGGIGITPVISIIEYIVEKKLDTQVKLFYSNRTEEEIAYKRELDNWQTNNKNIKVYYTITDCQPKDKTCSYGFINKEFLMENLCDLEQSMIFIFGPPKMVDVMSALSLEMGCAKESIKTEKFVGY